MKNSTKIIIVVALCIVVGIGLIIVAGSSSKSSDPYKDCISYEYKLEFKDSIPTTDGDVHASTGWKYALYTVTVYNNIDGTQLTVTDDIWKLTQDVYGTEKCSLYTEFYTGENAYHLTKLLNGEKCTIVLIFDVADENCSDDRLSFQSTKGFTIRK